MKITKNRLRQLIKEELTLLTEGTVYELTAAGWVPDDYDPDLGAWKLTVNGVELYAGNFPSYSDVVEASNALSRQFHEDEDAKDEGLVIDGETLRQVLVSSAIFKDAVAESSEEY